VALHCNTARCGPRPEAFAICQWATPCSLYVCLLFASRLTGSAEQALLAVYYIVHCVVGQDMS
jgi:hypothetical protein